MSRLGFSTVFVLGLLAGTAISVARAAENPTWQPAPVERLVKLPASYLKKSLDQDFAQSPLGQAIRSSESEIGLKAQTMADLKNAIGSATGDVGMELRHQFLAEKKAYVSLMSGKNALRKKHLETKARLFERMLDRVGQDKEGASPGRQELIVQQQQARSRFAASLSKVELEVFRTSAAPESRYAAEYGKNMAAIEQLAQAIAAHPMSDAATRDGQPMSRQDAIRGLLGEAQAELALIQQEEAMLGYMAKLVSLDAMALADEAMDVARADSEVPDVANPAGAVSFFVSR